MAVDNLLQILIVFIIITLIMHSCSAIKVVKGNSIEFHSKAISSVQRRGAEGVKIH